MSWSSSTLERSDVIAWVDAAGGDAPAEGLAAADRLAAWATAQQVRCVALLQAAGTAPVDTPLRTSRDTDRAARRAATLGDFDGFAEALARGAISAAHVDRLSESMRRLEPPQRDALRRDAARLLVAASATNADQFATFLRREERRRRTDDGMARLERQQRDVRLRRRVDGETGMTTFSLTLDPVAALSFNQLIEAAVEAMFHDRTPPQCPTDPIEKQGFLRAHALMRLVAGKGVRLGRPEIVVVVDTTQPDGASAPDVDWGLPVEVPERVLIDLFGRAHVHAVVVRNGVVLHAPGELELGRTTRLANRAQRRALRAVYSTCAIPGCATRFDDCQIHHVQWWRHGGRTDLCNLLPICSKHHALVHDGGWQLHLARDGQLTVTLPDGSVRTGARTRRRAA